MWLTMAFVINNEPKAFAVEILEPFSNYCAQRSSTGQVPLLEPMVVSQYRTICH